MSLPRYPAYKDSGVTWLGRVPNAWAISPLKHLAEFVNGCVFKPDSWRESGTPIIRIENLNGSLNFNFYDGEVDERHHVSKGNLLFGWSGNRGTSFGPFIWKATGLHFLNQHIFKVHSLDCNDRWLYWCLRAVTAHVEDQATGIIGMVHVTKGDLGAIKVPVPLPSEQLAIAAFLDRETAKIDALITEQEKLIALLAEKRQATISHAVTRGLNPGAPMKDSGVAWIGMVPAHWQVLRLKYLVKIGEGIQMGPFGGMLLDLSAQDTGYKVYGQENTISGDFTRGSRWISEDRFKELGRYCICEGDLVLTRKGSLGNARLITELPQPGICDSDTIRVRTNENVILPKFLARLLHEASYVETQISVSRRGAILSGVNSETIANLVLVVPPLEEQRALMGSLERHLEGFDSCANEVSRVIGLLKERRSALITAAVTGQIDVRGAVSLPGEPMEAVAA